MKRFEPTIVAFLCNWCSYSGADAAGRAQLAIPPEIKIVRVMCSGRVDPEFILRAFHDGADGVLVLGCHPGDCHYKEGNFHALRRVRMLSRLVTSLGVEAERLCLDWVSASEGERFAEVTAAMVERVRALGPLVVPARQPQEEAR